MTEESPAKGNPRHSADSSGIPSGASRGNCVSSFPGHASSSSYFKHEESLLCPPHTGSFFTSPLKLLSDGPHQCSVSSNQDGAPPSNAFLSLDPLREPEPYMFGLGTNEGLSDLFLNDLLH
jgi:hypothetical protein